MKTEPSYTFFDTPSQLGWYSYIITRCLAIFQS